MKIKDVQTLLEQIALIFASFVWTTIILTALAIFWAYQDVQARWEFVLTAPPEALAQAFPPTPTVYVTPTPTPWAGPPPTITPTSTKPPTPTATRVIPLPELLPETLNADDPVPVIVHTAEEVAELEAPSEAQSGQSGGVTIGILATPTPDAAAQPAQNVQAAPPTLTPTPAAVALNPPSQPAPVDATGPTNPFEDATPTRLIIGSIGIDSKIIPVGWNVIEKDGHEYSIWEVADYAVGWHTTSAFLGKPGNTVMAGHHNVNGEVFRDLVNVEVGDSVIVYAGNKKYEYRVDFKTIVKEKGETADVRRRNAQWITPSDDERLTLVTCWPYTNNTHRVIVVAKPL